MIAWIVITSNYNDYFLDRAILCTKNITVDRLNNDILNKLTFIDY
jgi:hypothetical protein